jgi:hypothetical protein
MASKDSNLERAKRKNLSKNFVDYDSENKEKSWTIDVIQKAIKNKTPSG